MTVTRADLRDYQDLRARWRADPVLYARTRLGIQPTRQQVQLLEAIAPFGAKVSVRSGHGVGKTASLAMTIWWHLENFSRSKTPCTAPTANQLYQVLFSEIARVQRLADEQARRLGLPPELWLSSLFRVVQDRVYDPSAPTEWFAAARTSRREKPDALQGFHASDIVVNEDDTVTERSDSGGSILFVLEEASGVPDEVLEVVEGALSSSRARLLMAGNPTRTSGFFALSHRRLRDQYTPLHFRCADSPLPAPDYREKLVLKYGEDSNVVRVRADGEFPLEDDDSLISIAHAEAACERDVPPDLSAPVLLGVDVARYGSDRTVFCVRRGRTVLHLEVANKQDTMTTAGRAVALRREWGATRVKVDVIGVGAGVVDRLRELGEPVDGVNVAEAATIAPRVRTRFASRAPEEKFDRQEALPQRLRDYLWLEVRAWLAEDEPSFAACDPDRARELAAELASVRYSFDSSGRTVVESKDAMKKRGLQSPDVAEALLMTFAPDGGASIWERL